VADFVSFDLHAVIDLQPSGESDAARKARADKLAWLRERDYRIVEVRAEDVAGDVNGVLARIAEAVA
jgi:tRNA/rRNA methyltransferase